MQLKKKKTHNKKNESQLFRNDFKIRPHHIFYNKFISLSFCIVDMYMVRIYGMPCYGVLLETLLRVYIDGRASENT